MDDIVQVPEGYTAPYIQWSSQQIREGLELTNDFLTVTAKDGKNFKSVFGSYVFESGNKYFFETKINKGHLIKIGLSRPYTQQKEAFSDGPHGWAFYNGEIRHNSNQTGQKYGATTENGDRVGVLLDMIEGTISFSINGKVYGVAFNDSELKRGQLVAACALINRSDSVSLRMMLRED